MTHELECFYDGERDDTEWRDAEDNPCICDILLDAKRTAWHAGWKHEVEYLMQNGQFCLNRNCNPYHDSTQDCDHERRVHT